MCFSFNFVVWKKYFNCCVFFLFFFRTILKNKKINKQMISFTSRNLTLISSISKSIQNFIPISLNPCNIINFFYNKEYIFKNVKAPTSLARHCLSTRISYAQGQYFDEDTREYFYYMDHHGQV